MGSMSPCLDIESCTGRPASTSFLQQNGQHLSLFDIENCEGETATNGQQFALHDIENCKSESYKQLSHKNGQHFAPVWHRETRQGKTPPKKPLKKRATHRKFAKENRPPKNSLGKWQRFALLHWKLQRSSPKDFIKTHWKLQRSNGLQ